ncbi:hypothetical protein SANTM175S_03963 [Streptomyces antimycoticus]
MSTLSVETSSRGSSSATSSPTSSATGTPPSVTDSPSAGRTTSVPSAEPPPSGLGGGAGARRPAGGRSGRGRRPGRLGDRLGGRGRGSGGGAGAVVDHGQLGTDLDRSSSATLMEARTPAAGGDLGVDLVGRDLEQRLVGLYVLTLGLQPAGDGALADALAERRKVTQTATVPVAPYPPRIRVVASSTEGRRSCARSGSPARPRCASPSASFCVGWAWMSSATSAGSASQL